MTLFHSSMALFYVILFTLSVCSFTFAANKEITGVTSVTKDNSCYHYIKSALLLIADMDNIDGGPQKTRVKRNGDGYAALDEGWAMVCGETPDNILKIGNIRETRPVKFV